MNADMMIGWLFVSLVAGVMIIIGLSQVNRKDEPVGFYTVTASPKK